MSLKLFVFTFIASLVMLSPVQAEESKTGAEPTVAPSPMEERIRAYRERVDQRELQRQVEYERRPGRNITMRSCRPVWT